MTVQTPLRTPFHPPFLLRRPPFFSVDWCCWADGISTERENKLQSTIDSTHFIYHCFALLEVRRVAHLLEYREDEEEATRVIRNSEKTKMRRVEDVGGEKTGGAVWGKKI